MDRSTLAGKKSPRACLRIGLFAWIGSWPEFYLVEDLRMDVTDVAGMALSVVESFKDPSTVSTFLVVVSYLALLRVILRTWEVKLLSPESRLKTRSKQRARGKQK